MLLVRRAKERGMAKHDWLQSYHTFSFADYYDPDYMVLKIFASLQEEQITIFCREASEFLLFEFL